VRRDKRSVPGRSGFARARFIGQVPITPKIGSGHQAGFRAEGRRPYPIMRSFLITNHESRITAPPQGEDARQNREIQHHVPGKRKMTAHVSEAPTANIDPAGFRRDAGPEEDHQQRS